MVGTLVYYAISPVHLRNVQLLAPHLAPWNIRIAYEKDGPWLNPDTLAGIDLETISFGPTEIPEKLWADRVGAVIFSTAQPRRAPMELLRAAIERGVPTIAIEESNQIALNQGRVNNYVLPVDRVLVASRHERVGMVGAGFPENRFAVTGWPFYSGRVGAVPDERKRQAKKELGLDPDRPVAALTLTGLFDAGESPAVRRRQISMAALGLPGDYQFVIKPHPIEPLDTLMPFVRECAPNATVIEGMVKVDQLLEAVDVLLNRGVSQVCIEALLNDIPVVVVDTEVTTPFHGTVDRVIARNEADIKGIIEKIGASERWQELYKPFYEEHVPHPPQEALVLTCESIKNMADRGMSEVDLGVRWFDLALCFAWFGDRQKAAEIIKGNSCDGASVPCGEFLKLIEYQASFDDLEVLKLHFGTGFRSQFLRCLWVEQLELRNIRPADVDREWLADFPIPLNAVWFIAHVRRWVFLLLRTGQVEYAAALMKRMAQEHIHIPGVEPLVGEVEDYLSGVVGRARVLLKARARKTLQPIRHWMRNRLF